MAARTVCCSAPGKVLITGGYLVLERPNAGIVFTVNARFYSTIHPRPDSAPTSTTSTPTTSSPTTPSALIRIFSPQFNSMLEYRFQWQPKLFLEKISAGDGNKYIEKTILAALAAVITTNSTPDCFDNVMGSGIDIYIMGDNQFYSLTNQLKRRKLPPTTKSLQSLPPFLEVQSSLENIPKTGLGSSAALVSSLTAAILSYFGVVDLQQGTRKEMIHNLAQFSHCAAQGKIGSGFDISSAVYGSQVYVRFDPTILQPLLAEFDHSVPDLKALLTLEWDNVHKACALPAGMTLVLGDVGIGSNTPNLVRKVLEWKASGSATVQEVWNNLNQANNRIEECFSALRKIELENSTNFIASLHSCAELVPSMWKQHSDVGLILHDLRQVFLTGVRQGLKRMGELAGAPLEPDEQSTLADATMDVTGCLISGVPGAGGYDAIFAIALSPAALARIETLWEGWTQMRVLPMILREEPTGLALSTPPTVAQNS